MNADLEQMNSTRDRIKEPEIEISPYKQQESYDQIQREDEENNGLSHGLGQQRNSLSGINANKL
jgi:hypothetical protein